MPAQDSHLQTRQMQPKDTQTGSRTAPKHALCQAAEPRTTGPHSWQVREGPPLETPREQSPTSTLMLDFCLQNRRREHVSVAFSPSVYGSLFWWPHLHGHLVTKGLRSLRHTTMESGWNLRGVPVSTTWARCRKAAWTEPAPGQDSAEHTALFPSSPSTFHGVYTTPAVGQASSQALGVMHRSLAPAFGSRFETHPQQDLPEQPLRSEGSRGEGEAAERSLSRFPGPEVELFPKCPLVSKAHL